jgi:ribosome maturation factor RimP
MAGGVAETIRAVIEAKLAESGLELFDIRFFQAGPRPVLRVTIDSPAGITIGECEKASNDISILLDVEDFSPGRRYTLEVSSPGIDRPLKTERDYKRIADHIVVLQMGRTYPGKKTLRGKVVGCADGVLRCEIDGETVELPLSSIASGKEEIQFK